MNILSKELLKVARMLKVADGVDDDSYDDMLNKYVVVDPVTGEEQRVKNGTLKQDAYGHLILEYVDWAGNINHARYEQNRRRFVKNSGTADYFPVNPEQKKSRDNNARYLHEGVEEYEANFGYMQSALERFADLVAELSTFSYAVAESAAKCRSRAQSAQSRLEKIQAKLGAADFARKLNEFAGLQRQVEDAIREAEIANATCGKIAIRIKNVIIVATRKVERAVPGGSQATDPTPGDWNNLRKQPTMQRDKDGEEIGWIEELGSIPSAVNSDRKLHSKSERVAEKNRRLEERLKKHKDKLVILKHQLENVTYIFRDVIDGEVRAIEEEAVGNLVGVPQRKDLNYETKSQRSKAERDDARSVTSSRNIRASWLSDIWDWIKDGVSTVISYVKNGYDKLFSISESQNDLVDEVMADVEDMEDFVQEL